MSRSDVGEGDAMSQREATGRGARAGSVAREKWATKVEAAFAHAVVDTQRAGVHEMAEAIKLTPELSRQLRFVQVEEVVARLDRLRAGLAAALSRVALSCNPTSNHA